MPNPPRRLGRGLSAIISFSDAESQPPATPEQSPVAKEPEGTGRMIKVSQLRPNPAQPRQEFPPEHLKDLADSIAKTGVIQPIVVRKKGPSTYEIIAGERRWRAAQMAGLSELPAVVREATDEEMLEVALVENIHREDLNAIERAQAYKKYCDSFSLTSEQVAQRVGEDRTTVTNYIRLLELPNEVKQWVREGKLSMGHARCLLGLTSASMRVQAAKECMDKDLSVRVLEKLVRDRQAARSQPSEAQTDKKAKRPLIREIEQVFVRALGTRVEILESARKGRGKVIIHYASLEDFDRLCAGLGVQQNIE